MDFRAKYSHYLPQPGEEFDVIVCGGGPAGIGAAVAACEAGAKTLLLLSLIHIFMYRQSAQGQEHFMVRASLSLFIWISPEILAKSAYKHNEAYITHVGIPQCAPLQRPFAHLRERCAHGGAGLASLPFCANSGR